MSTNDRTLFKTICADFEDIHPSDLHGISRLLGAQYLCESNGPHRQQYVKGIVWGASLRLFVSLHVQLTESILTLTGTRRPIHVHFLYLAASPQTYITDDALRTMGIEDMVVVGVNHGQSSTGSLRLPLKINGYPLLVARSPSDAHFSHLNILGQDFVQVTGADVFFGGDIPRFEISFF
ncbi:hypothetical protein BX616_006616 [Lobosporangium transversale]|nr:hypothetical protein BX616_006616 [Lobosporangium transversale]